MKILVVDDEPITLDMIEQTLTNAGYTVIKATDGYQALESIDRDNPDLIISDIMMPNMSGLGLLSLLKQFYFSKIPVILVSTLDKAEVTLTALGLGAVDFIVKPINFDELVLRVKKYSKKENPE